MLEAKFPNRLPAKWTSRCFPSKATVKETHFSTFLTDLRHFFEGVALFSVLDSEGRDLKARGENFFLMYRRNA
jgi:hypothetical protein